MLVRAAVAVMLCVALIAGGIYLATHVVAPRLFTHYEYAPELTSLPKRTTDAHGHEGDPVNVVIVGSGDELRTAMHMAGWVIADSLTRGTKLAIARSVLFNRPDSAAPVSPLFLFGRQQDVAFEREVGSSARRRHHARFWLAAGVLHGGRAVWLGDATFDQRAGLSHRSLHPTHHIATDVDQERDTLMADLARAGQITLEFEATGTGPRVDAHNAEGDRFDTDGEMDVAVIAPENAPLGAPRVLPPPLPVAWKNRAWSWFIASRIGRLPRP